MIMHLLLIVTLAFPAAEMPGTRFAQTSAETVLYVGPGAQHAGVLTLPAGRVVRVEDTGAAFHRVFLAEGFPVYVHSDYAQIDRTNQQVRVTAQRVNARALPAVSSVRAIGQLSSDDGPLSLLAIEGSWVRLRAPAHLGLYAPAESLATLDASVARTAWAQLEDTRQSRQQVALASWRATDPSWKRGEQERQRVAALERIDARTLSVADREALEAEAALLISELTDGKLIARVEDVARKVREVELGLRAEETARVALEAQQARELANLAREARYLGFGLRFEGQGTVVQVEGRIKQRTAPDEDVAVYTLTDMASGSDYKLTLAREIGKLPPLLGKRVVLTGRRMTLKNVTGPVLVIDDVVRVVE